MNTVITHVSKTASLGFIAWAFCYYSIGQPTTSTTIWKNLINIENDTTLSYNQKLQQLLILKKQFENHQLPPDSVYARTLHKIGLYDYKINNDIATKNGVLFTQAAIRINTAKKNSIPALCVNSYNNMAIYYESLHQYSIAANYFDSAILLRRQFKVHEIAEARMLLDKARMLQKAGDYQRALEVFNAAVLKAKETGDSSILQSLLNQRAKSYLQNNKPE